MAGRGKPKGLPKSGGRAKGTPNKVPTLLKEAILMAADSAGGREGIAGYLKVQAQANPGPFMALLGKVLPLQITGDGDSSGAIVITWAGPQPKAGGNDQ